MTAAARAWLDAALLGALAAAALAASPGIAPALPRLPGMLVAAAGGAGAGWLLGWHAGPGSAGARSRFAARAVLAVVMAAGEEAVWRHGVQGALIRPFGPAGALAAAAAGFGLVHGPGLRRRALHGATGAAFGAAYLAGGLGAAAACHAAYNVALRAAAGWRR